MSMSHDYIGISVFFSKGCCQSYLSANGLVGFKGLGTPQSCYKCFDSTIYQLTNECAELCNISRYIGLNESYIYLQRMTSTPSLQGSCFRTPPSVICTVQSTEALDMMCANVREFLRTHCDQLQIITKRVFKCHSQRFDRLWQY